MRGLEISWSSAHTSLLCRAREVTDGDQTTTGKDTEWNHVFPELQSIDGTDGFQKITLSHYANKTGRHIVITEGLTSNVLNSLQTYSRKSERGIVLRNSIAVASPHKTLTEQMFMKVGSEI